MIPGLSPRGRTLLAQLEHNRLWPGAAAEALRLWAGFVRSPYHRLYDPSYGEGCGIWQCCGDPADYRWILETVAHALPRRDARDFRKPLAAIDELW
jgi:hypothetical protein